MKIRPGPLSATREIALPALDVEDRSALEDLYVRGTPETTLRAYERDLVYLTAWKLAAFGTPLVWPE